MTTLTFNDRALLDGHIPFCTDCSDERLCAHCSAQLEALGIELKQDSRRAVRRLLWEHEGITLDSQYFLKRYTTLRSHERENMGNDPSHETIMRIRRYENLITKFQNN